MTRQRIGASGRRSVQLGELVAAAFDGAAEHSTDPQEVSRLAARVVMRVVRRAQRRVPISLSPRHAA